MALQKEKLWEIYTAKNPKWKTDGVKLTADGLEKFFNQVFDRGYELGVANGKALASKSKPEKTRAESILDGMFGR